MKKYATTIVFIAFSILQVQASFSQDVSLGLTVGINHFMHNSDNANFSWTEGNMIATDKLSDKGKSIAFGFVAEFQPSETANDAFQFRFSYNTYSFQSEYFELNNERNDVSLGDVIIVGDSKTPMDDTNQTFIHRNEFTINSISADLLYKYNIIDDLSIVLGTKLNYFINKEIEATQNLLRPLAAQFKREVGKVYFNNDRSILIYQNDNVEEISSFNIGATIGLQYKIKLKSLEICPIVLYNFYSTNLMNDTGWKLTTITIGFDFMFGV
ncbi:MAG: hypothetical protein CVV22_00395 [Ignavibacteriae bacterium HGW-Ignavibacteriae-1]|jgi:hypothetical protein|nr:MAG: hypothetical protein CVV22_00395 [Ignavibacteriae bacterium HGW-Ignavibacteriae-1]